MLNKVVESVHESKLRAGLWSQDLSLNLNTALTSSASLSRLLNSFELQFKLLGGLSEIKHAIYYPVDP